MSVLIDKCGDVYYDGTHNVSLMVVFVDSASDLSGLVSVESIYFQLGSKATDVSTGDVYRCDSNGVWHLQPSESIQLDLTGYYTSAETDALLAGKQPILTAEQQNVIDNITIPNRNLYVQGTEPTGVIPLHSTWINGKIVKEYVDETYTPSIMIEQGSFETFSGAEIPSTTRVRTTMPSEISPAGTYTVSITGADDAVIYVYDENQVYSESDSFITWDSMPRTFTIVHPFYIRYAFRYSDNSAIEPSDVSGLTINFRGWK